MSDIFSKLMNLFYPQSCLICSRFGSNLCDSCFKRFKFTMPECYKCRRISSFYKTHPQCRRSNNHSLTKVLILYEYNLQAKQLISKYKFTGAYKLIDALYQLIHCQNEFQKYLKSLAHEVIIVPVPIHQKRKMERGFNQVVLLTQKISMDYQLFTIPDFLIRTKYSESLAHSSKDSRLLHVKDSFKINHKFSHLIPKFKTVVLVDDIMTTGSTIEEISKVLKKHFPTLNIEAICLFRGKPKYKF